ncbi:hypothetical protein LEP1GSC016_3949 [Leptospira borgpetersenii serovar Hardjo-bovis str. Sponselee]|uniref:Uncharacterized protein n=1 Tax=Leptospira borgpetersenii serovar Hardjo-bovis str. Sponselee TaxID=1303729 RepID=M6BDF2_LEPBO|nr:hypothetical protein LEP1GSC016_3949 [Leptospira borgpetersenii serovar Hardjo-bovis str. Sponselee]
MIPFPKLLFPEIDSHTKTRTEFLVSMDLRTYSPNNRKTFL